MELFHTQAFTRLRAAVLLLVLAGLVALGLQRGFEAAFAPFPQAADPPLCVDTPLERGDRLRPEQVTVSVLNAGERLGLGGATLDGLVDQGFARGNLDNLDPDESGNGEDGEDGGDGGTSISTAELWSPGGETFATRLLSTYLGGNVPVVDRAGPGPGLYLVVGDQFPGTRQGREAVRVREDDATVCSPAEDDPAGTDPAVAAPGLSRAATAPAGRGR